MEQEIVIPGPHYICDQCGDDFIGGPLFVYVNPVEDKQYNYHSEECYKASGNLKVEE